MQRRPRRVRTAVFDAVQAQITLFKLQGCKPTGLTSATHLRLWNRASRRAHGVIAQAVHTDRRPPPPPPFFRGSCAANDLETALKSKRSLTAFTWILLPPPLPPAGIATRSGQADAGLQQATRLRRLRSGFGCIPQLLAGHLGRLATKRASRWTYARSRLAGRLARRHASRPAHQSEACARRWKIGPTPVG